MDDREGVLEDLHNAANPLIATCSPEVTSEIESAVVAAVQVWNDSASHLAALCAKYQDAVQLWKQYKDAAAGVQNWVDHMNTADPATVDPHDVKVRCLIICLLQTLT